MAATSFHPEVFDDRRLLRSIIDAATVAIFVKDLDGRYVLMNRHGVSLLGLTESEILGKTDFDFFSREIAERMRADDLRVMERGETVEVEETVELNGQPRTYLVSKAPLRDEEDRPCGLGGIGFDVTERSRMAETLRAQTEALTEADRRKDQFLAMLGHELRNPMAPLRHVVELFHSRADSLDEELRGGVAVAQRQLDQMRRIVDDLLDVARLSRGRMRLERRPMALRRAVDAAVETVRPYLEQRGSRLELVLPEPGLRVDGDEARLAQVIANLLENAAKYSPRGGKISLAVTAGDTWVTVEVRDRGIGMEPAVLDRAFDLFYQREPTLERTEGGLGVGLTVAKDVVELHGGEITAESAGDGTGSVLRVRLPRLAERDVPEEPPPEEHGAPAGCSVLVVDDNRDSADSLGTLLELGGHRVETAYDGESALEAAEGFEPNVVLLDIGLPRLDGYQVARRLRRSHGDDLLLVALTGYGQESARVRSREAGFDHHLLKPVDLEALRALLAEAAEPGGEDRAAPAG